MPWWLFAPHPRVRSDRGASGEARPLCGRVRTELDSAVWQGLGPETGLLCPHLAPKLGAATATPGHLEPADSAHGTRCQGRINPGVWAQSRQRGWAPLACPPPLESRRPLPRPQWGADEGPGPLHAPRRAKQTHDTSTSRDLGALGRRSDGDDGRFGERERHLSEKGHWARARSRVRSGRTLSLPPSTRDMVGCRGRREEAARPPGRLRCETPLRARRRTRSALDEPQAHGQSRPLLVSVNKLLPEHSQPPLPRTFLTCYLWLLLSDTGSIE